MTVVRRELPLSRSASHPWRGLGRRIAQARALQSCPRRRAVDPLQETHGMRGGSGSGAPRPLGHGGPNEPGELPGDGGDGDRGALAVANEVTVTSMQALLRAPRFRDDGRRLAGGMTSQPIAERRPMAIVPGGLDEDPSSMGVAGLRERASTLPFPRRVF